MTRIVLAIATALLIASPPAIAASKSGATTPAHRHVANKHVVHKKRRVVRHWHGYGFLPGYRPPEVIERERERRARENGPPWYGPAWPGFYRGRWNGGGFGPCYVSTPIGYMWTCGN